MAEAGILAGRVLRVGWWVGYVKGCCLDISSMWMCGVTRSGGVCGGARRPGRSQLEVTWTS